MYKKILKSLRQPVSNHSESIRSIADSYAQSKGFRLNHTPERAKVDPKKAANIASAYHNMPHNPSHPAVKESYNALIGETVDQFKHMMRNGLKISKIQEGQSNPYGNSKEMLKDVRENNHLHFFPTESGFGSKEGQASDHPMLAPTNIHHEGKPLLANDVFRIVHDYFGHGKEGHGFGPNGEESAWKTHKQMYSPKAQKALTTETRGQNSWVNFGPHGESNRANPGKTVYADQKAGIMPDWTLEHEQKPAIAAPTSTPAMKKSEYFEDLYKSLIKKPHTIKDRKPHFIFSAEKPMFKEEQKINMSHEDVLDFLKAKGYKTEEMDGKYGDLERSILVHNPAPHAVKHLLNLSANLGQESSIYSNGYDHEMHYHHGDNAGGHVKGQGTENHKKPPADHYSIMEDGTTFTHNFNFDEVHGPEQSMVKQKETPLVKSENGYRVYLAKNEGGNHPLVNSDPDLNMVHYSTEDNIREIDPNRQGERTREEGGKKGKPLHPMSFFYLEGTKPESIVTQGATQKYITKIGSKKFYDVGKDPDGIHSRLHEKSKGKQINPGIVNREEYHEALKDAGYHGIYNSMLDREDMRGVVGSFYPIKPDNSYPVHRKDKKEVSVTDHHGESEKLSEARKFAKENQSHSPKFLTGLSKEFKEENG